MKGMGKTVWAIITLATIATAGAAEGVKEGRVPESDKTTSPGVFDQPPAEQLSKITHPGLREELLHMANTDQTTRRQGT